MHATLEPYQRVSQPAKFLSNNINNYKTCIETKFFEGKGRGARVHIQLVYLYVYDNSPGTNGQI